MLSLKSCCLLNLQQLQQCKGRSGLRRGLLRYKPLTGKYSSVMSRRGYNKYLVKLSVTGSANLQPCPLLLYDITTCSCRGLASLQLNTFDNITSPSCRHVLYLFLLNLRLQLTRPTNYIYEYITNYLFHYKAPCIITYNIYRFCKLM